MLTKFRTIQINNTYERTGIMKIFKDKKLIKSSLIFTFTLLPFALIGIYFTISETYKALSEEYKELLINQLGSESAVIGLSMIEPIILTVVCSFFGYIISSKVGLMKPIKFEKKPSLITLILGTVTALLLVGDLFVFAKFIPQVAESYETPITVKTFIYTILYGGIVEEILLRLFFMSLLSLIIKKTFFKNNKNCTSKIFIIANIFAALLFAAGHLPATYQLFGEITPLLLFRCLH